MTEDIKPEVIKRTQDSLKKFIKKPPLTEKLLKKPPFRFLHDLITSIMRETGFLQGLYNSDELNPDNIKDRDGKIAFLEKLIAAIKLSTGANVTARPAKIVAGLEVEKTNELLQIIGKALDKRIDSSKAVEQILNKGSKITSNSKAKEVTKKKSSKDVILDESKTKSKTEVKKKKPSTTRSKDNVVKESPSKSKQVPVTKKDTPSRKKERSPTKQVNDNTGQVKNVAFNNVDVTEPINVISKQSDDIKNEPIKEEKKHIENDNKMETSENESLIIKQKTTVLQKKPSIEKLVLQKKSSREKLILSEKSIDGNVDINSNDDIDQKLNDVSSGAIDIIPVNEQKVNVREVEKQNENDEVETHHDRKEKEMKEDTPKIKRPSSAHHGHRRHSSARRISDVENSPDSKMVNQTTNSGDSGASGNLSSTVTNSASEEVQILGASTVISGEPVVKVSPPLVTRPRTATRPPSARPGAPRVRDRGHVEVVEDVKSPTVPVNVIVDAENSKDEDDENLVVLESQIAPTVEKVDHPKEDLSVETSTDFGLGGKEQGHLVAQILETQRELELSGGLSSKVEIEWEGGRKRERESALKEVDRLRGAIQSLTRAANPLGKLIDFLQEDVDSMQRELIHWQQMNAQLAKELQVEQSLTETSLEPFKQQLDELDQLIEDEIEKVSAVKANIIKNDERILKLLPGVQHS